MELTLVCRTIGDEHHDNWSYALIKLSRAEAKRLLAARDLFASVVDAAATHFDSLYGVEFFNGSCSWGSGLDNILNFDETVCEWFSVYGDPGFKTEDGTCCLTLRVVEGGVMWTAAPKHGSGEFETEVLPWSQLAAAARGEDPFSKLYAAAEQATQCRECGEPMIVLANGVSHHLDIYDEIDHDQDSEHTAVAECDEMKIERRSKDWAERQICNPLGYSSSGPDPSLVVETKLADFVAYGFFSVWNEFGDVREVLEARRAFLRVLTGAICDLWEGRSWPGCLTSFTTSGNAWTAIPPGGEPAVLVRWEVWFKQEAMSFGMLGVPGGSNDIWLSYDFLRSPRLEVWKIVQKACATVGMDVPTKFSTLADKTSK